MRNSFITHKMLSFIENLPSIYSSACDKWTVLPKPDLHRDVNRFGHSAVVRNGYVSKTHVFNFPTWPTGLGTPQYVIIGL